jgi:hypothetical protein
MPSLPTLGKVVDAAPSYKIIKPNEDVSAKPGKPSVLFARQAVIDLWADIDKTVLESKSLLVMGELNDEKEN